MSPIEYLPPALKGVINSPYGPKRLKNRTGTAVCKNCNYSQKGGILEIHAASIEHDSETGHTIKIIEESCRLGLIQQQ